MSGYLEADRAPSVFDRSMRACVAGLGPLCFPELGAMEARECEKERSEKSKEKERTSSSLSFCV